MVKIDHRGIVIKSAKGDVSVAQCVIKPDCSDSVVRSQ